MVGGPDEDGDGVADGVRTTVRANNTTWCPADICGQSIATLPNTGCTPRYSPSSYGLPDGPGGPAALSGPNPFGPKLVTTGRSTPPANCRNPSTGPGPRLGMRSAPGGAWTVVGREKRSLSAGRWTV